MALKVRIGIGAVPVTGPDPEVGPALTELIDELETRQIDSIWLSDLVSSPQTDPLIGLAYAAGRTERLKLGTGVLVLPGRNPSLVAAQLAGLTALAPGRVLPAFGLRPALAGDRDMFPVPQGQRAAVFDEALAVIRALLTEPSVTHHGEFFHLEGASVAPLPTKPLDLWLGGRTAAAMRRVGRLADGWLGSFITPAEAERLRQEAERSATQAGRAVEDDHYGTNIQVAPEGLPDSALVDTLARARTQRPDLDEPERLVCRGWADAKEQLHRFIDAGLSKFVVRPAVPVTSRRDFLDQFCDELLPLQN